MCRIVSLSVSVSVIQLQRISNIKKHIKLIPNNYLSIIVFVVNCYYPRWSYG